MFELSEIKKLRISMNLTQKEIARQSGVSQSLIAKVEAGKLDPTFSKAKKIMDTLSSLSNKKVRAEDLINTSIISVSPNCPVKKAILKMKKYNISQMPVVEEKKAIGFVSEAVILEALIKDKNADSTVGNIMKNSPPIIPKEASLNIVTNLLREYPIILVEEKGKLKGHITKSDILTKAFK